MLKWWRRDAGTRPAGPAEPVEPWQSVDDAPTQMWLSEADGSPRVAVAVAEDLSLAQAGDDIGGYRLLRLLGEGGMGVVYEAEQPDPRRRVALKIRRPSKAGAEDQGRLFRREVAALARLSHPGIAAIYEAGRTAGGLDYFAMEIVDGVPLQQWASGAMGRPAPPLEERLRVFANACLAVAAAHDRGVVHRDLKPSNILVDAVGSSPRAPAIKVLDFGLASIVDAEAEAGDRDSADAAPIRGTLAYMSPEQVRGDPAAAGPRSDVWSLGVILYELVTGRLPHEVHGRALPEAARVICENPPAPPLRLAGEATRVDADLRTVLLKALEKTPERRYASAAALREDVERWLDGEPVLARPRSAFYHVGKLAARHRLAFGLMTALFVVLGAFAVAMAWQSARLVRERDRAERERARAQQVSHFLGELFELSDPDQARGQGVTVREVLDRGAVRMEHELRDQPEVRAELLEKMAWSYEGLGLYDRAAELAVQALALQRALHPADHPAVVWALIRLGNVQRAKGDYAGAAAQLSEAQALADRLPGETEVRGLLLNARALLARETGRPGEAEPLFRAVLSLRRGLHGNDHPDVANSLTNLGLVLYDLERLPEAEACLREALALRRRLVGNDHPRTLNTIHLLGRTLGEQGRAADAWPLLEEALAGRRRTLGPRHPDLLHSLAVMAELDLREGRASAAETRVREAQEIFRTLPDASRPARRNGRLLFLLGSAAEGQGRLAEAEGLYRAAAEQRAGMEPGDPDRLRGEVALWAVRVALGNAGPAEAPLRDLAERARTGRLRVRVEADLALGACLAALGRAADAEPLLLAAHEAQRGSAMRDPDLDARVREQLVCLYQGWGRPAQAERWRAAAGSVLPADRPVRCGRTPPAPRRGSSP